MSKSLALQKALRETWIASPAVVALVPAANIVDRHKMPPASPSVVLGLDQARPDDGNVKGDREEVLHDVHCYMSEPSTEGVKRIMAALGDAMRAAGRPSLGGGLHLGEWSVSRRVTRRADDGTSHGILTVRALIGGGP